MARPHHRHAADPDLAPKLGSEGEDLSAPTIPWHGLDDGYPARLPLWTLGNARDVVNLLGQGWTPDQVMGSPEWRKFEFTINDINDMQTMSERGMLAMKVAMMKPLQKPLTPTALAKASFIDIGNMRAPLRKRLCPFDEARTVQKQLWLAEDGLSFGTDPVEGDIPVWGCTNCGHLYPRRSRLSPKQKRLQETLDKLLGKKAGMHSEQLRQDIDRIRGLIADDPGAPDANLRRFLLRSYEAKLAGADRPLTSPLFNFREACKEMTLLEDHLLHPPKECPDCIRKHFLKIEGLLEESISLGMPDEMGGWITNLIEIWVGLQAQWIDNAESSADIAQEIRQLRKALTPMCFDLRTKMAARIASRFLEATTRGYLKFEDEQRVGKFRYKFMGNQGEGYIYIKVSKAPGWQRIGKLYQGDKGWGYKHRGYTHGVWAKWWEAASKMHKAQHFAPTKAPTPPGYKTKVEKSDAVSDDDIDFGMFANTQTDLELVDTSLERVQQYQGAWP